MPPQEVNPNPVSTPRTEQVVTPPLTTSFPNKTSMKNKILIAVCASVLFLIIAFIFVNRSGGPKPVAVNQEFTPCTDITSTSTQYLIFQLFTDINTPELGNNFPPPNQSVEDSVKEMVSKIGSTGCASNKLGFAVGPIAFDHTDAQVRERIQSSFGVSLKYDVAVALHLDDSMFWGKLNDLNSPENIEWLDWNKTLNTGRRVDWSATPTKIKPQLCINSRAVVSAVAKRAALIGEEVKKGLDSLSAAGKPELFAGVIAGWETQMGRDFDTGRSPGYCAMTNKGYSATNPPASEDQVRVDITKEFIDLWTSELAKAGVPSNRIYSHIAVAPQISDAAADSNRSQLQKINFTPPSVAFGPKHYAGFSTYPGTAYAEQIKAERAKNGNPPWISAEGTSLDPALAEVSGVSEPMEPYLAILYGDGAVMVNIFGWGVGPQNNAFRKAAESAESIQAYQKFLSGTALSNISTGPVVMALPDKVRKIQEMLPVWIPNNKSQQPALESLMGKLDGYLKSGKLKDADRIADEILTKIGQ